MLSPDAKDLLKHFIDRYKKNGENRFDIDSYLGIHNAQKSIDELKEAGILEEQNNILQTLSINFDAIKG